MLLNIISAYSWNGQGLHALDSWLLLPSQIEIDTNSVLGDDSLIQTTWIIALDEFHVPMCVCVQSTQSFKRQARSFVMMIANMVGHQVKVLTLERQRHGRRLKLESIACCETGGPPPWACNSLYNLANTCLRHFWSVLSQRESSSSRSLPMIGLAGENGHWRVSIAVAGPRGGSSASSTSL